MYMRNATKMPLSTRVNWKQFAIELETTGTQMNHSLFYLGLRVSLCRMRFLSVGRNFYLFHVYYTVVRMYGQSNEMRE